MGEEVELTPWQQGPIPAKGTGAVVVGVEWERAQLDCPCTLKRWESAGPRTVILNDVTSLANEKAAP